MVERKSKLMDKPLLLYAPMSLRDQSLPPSAMMYPFWGESVSDKAIFTKAVFRQLSFNKNYYSLTENPAEADYIFLPYNYWAVEKNKPILLEKAFVLSKKLRKPLLLDAFGDRMDKIEFEHSVVLRCGQYQASLTNRDVIVPAYVEDLLVSYKDGVWQARLKQEGPPVVGFAGWAHLPILDNWPTYLKDLPLRFGSLFHKSLNKYRKGVFLREEIMRDLESFSSIKTNFLIRPSFSGHTSTLSGLAGKLRIEFVNNIANSDYTLCVKGDGNFSTRFYEALSLGRIPVFIDTDCVLPLAGIIKYPDCILTIAFDDAHKAGEVITAFHTQISPEEFIARQKLAREIFEKYLRLDNFTPHLMSSLRDRLPLVGYK